MELGQGSNNGAENNNGAGAQTGGANSSNNNNNGNLNNNNNNGGGNNENGGNNNNGGAANNNQNGGNNNPDNDTLERLIQSAVDRATQKLGTENKNLREELSNLQKSKMTDDELKDAQIKAKELDLEQREAALKLEQNRMYAVKAIKNANLDDGSTTALELVDLVMADDEKDIDKRVNALNSVINKLVQAQVNKTFTDNGRNPGKGNDNGGKNDDKNDLAREIGKKTAETNKNARSVIDYYTTGGKK